ncbi:Benzaldehyde lyase [compost metagenome]
MTSATGGELVARTLRAAGVEKIFSLHGAHIDTIFQACADQGVSIVDTRHEAAAGHAAEGHARTTRKLGVALVTAGGGFTNVMTPIANAFLDRTPVLFLTGSGALRDDETNTLQAGIDQVAIAKPVTKWAHRVSSAEQIPRLIMQAVRIATTAPRGPVLLDLPWDVLTNQVDAASVEIPPQPISLPGGLRVEDADAVLDLLRNAQRPVIVVGSDAGYGGDADALPRLADRTGTPVFSDTEGLGQLSGIPDLLHGGLIQGLHGLGKTGAAPDLVLMLGLRFGLSTGHGTGQLIPRDARIVQIDSDARELGRLQPVHLGLVADPSAAIRSLADRAQAHDRVIHSAWQERLAKHVRRRRDLVLDQAKGAKGAALHPLEASAIVAAHIDEETIVIADGALTYLWLTEVVAKARPAAFLCHGYLGSMGVGFGIAVGAQVAAKAKGKRAIFVTGDGAVGYSIAEFDTLVRHGLPLTVIVMNNRSWGATLHFQQFTGGPERITHTRLENGNYHDVASAFGADAHIATDGESLSAALAAALTGNRPTCINVIVDIDPIPPEELFIMGMDPLAPPPQAAA